MPMLFPVNLGGSLGTGGGGGGGGGTSLQLISSHDFSVTATDTVDFSTSGVSEVLLVLSQANTPGVYGIQVSDNDGATFYDTAGDYIVSRVDAAAQLDNTAQAMFLWGQLKTTNDMWMNLFPLHVAKSAHSFATGNSVNTLLPGTVWSYTKDTVVGPFDAIRFFSASGNVTAGTLYAYKKVAAP